MNMRNMLLGGLGALAALAMTAAPAAAETLTPLDTGWYDSAGSHSPGNQNYITGRDGGDEWRSFIVFTIPAGTPVTAATLNLYSFDVAGGPNDLALFDVTTGVPVLLNGTAGVAAYADLGSGASYGTLAGVTTNTTISITLTPAAVAAINAAQGSTFAIGMVNATLSDPTDYIFGSSAPAIENTLDLTRGAPATVPTMSEWAMILMGLLLAGGAAMTLARRRAA